MNIGIDLTKFDGAYVGGVSTFAIGLTHGIANAISSADRIVLLVTRNNRDDLWQLFGRHNVSLVEIDESGWHRYALSLLGYLGGIFGTFKLPYWYSRLFRSNMMKKIESAVDVLVAPMTTLSLPTGRVPSILCVHDIQHEYHPEYFSLRERASRWGAYRLSCWEASAVQASSQFVKDCLLEKFSFLPAEKIFVAPEGVDFEAFSSNASMEPPGDAVNFSPRSFLFYPAQFWPHKNHLLLVEALAAFRDRNGYELPCILTGQDAGVLKSTLEAVEQTRLSMVQYLGKVPFGELLWLYANCRAVLALGLHESSSLPLREGALFGKPLICSDISPNRELARDLFVIPFESRSAAELTAIFDVLVSDESLIEKSEKNATAVRSFDWKTVAEGYVAVARDLHRRTVEASRVNQPADLNAHASSESLNLDA